jgi:hypothetical protein
MHNDKREHVATDADAKYDTQFEGDDFAFTLNVSEGSTAVGTVTVQLQAKVTLDNALFIVNKDTGALTRVKGIKQFDKITNNNAYNTVTWHDGTDGSEDKAGTRLVDMLVWFDTRYGAVGTQTYPAENPNVYVAGAEYLIRVAASEQIPKMYITLPVDDTATKLRLRGTGGERVIQSNGTPWQTAQYFNTAHTKRTDTAQGVNVPKAFLSGAFFNMRRGILQLENNITIQGRDIFDNTIYTQLIEIQSGSLIMKNGSVLTGHTGITTVNSDNNVLVLQNEIYNGRNSLFQMEGGEIRGNTSIDAITRFTQNLVNGTTGQNSGPGRFVKTGGIIAENTNSKEVSANRVLFATLGFTTKPENCISIPDTQEFIIP